MKLLCVIIILSTNEKLCICDQCIRPVFTCCQSVNSKLQKELFIQFGIGLSLYCDSIDKKVILMLDTGTDINALNRKTFQKLSKCGITAFKCNSRKL